MKRILMVAVMLVFLLGYGLPVQAQEAALSPDTIVSSTGEIYEASSQPDELAQNTPFQGTGELEESVVMNVEGMAPLQPLSPSVPSTVIGADGRHKVSSSTAFPNRTIAFLEVTFPNGSGTCTGWFYGPRVVATAGHCVYSHDAGGWATSITVWPGRNGSYAPYGSTTMHTMWSVVGWTDSGSPDYDYGAIQTNDAKGNTVGWFGYRWQSSNSFPGYFTVKGYPGDKPYGEMWFMSGMILGTGYHLWYSIDTYPGQSGSPLYQVYNGTCCYGVGIHTYGVSISGTHPYHHYNSATRIRQAVFNNMKSWKAAPYP